MYTCVCKRIYVYMYICIYIYIYIYIYVCIRILFIAVLMYGQYMQIHLLHIYTHTHTLTHTHTSTQTLSFSFLVPFYNDTHSPVFTRTQIHLAALIRLRKRALYIYTPKKPYPTAAAIYDTHTRIRSTKKPCIFTKKTLFIHRGDL